MWLTLLFFSDLPCISLLNQAILFCITKHIQTLPILYFSTLPCISLYIFFTSLIYRDSYTVLFWRLFLFLWMQLLLRCQNHRTFSFLAAKVCIRRRHKGYAEFQLKSPPMQVVFKLKTFVDFSFGYLLMQHKGETYSDDRWRNKKNCIQREIKELKALTSLLQIQE